MMPSAPWNGTVSTLRKRGQRSPHVGVLHEISEVLVSRESEAGGGAIDHGVHRIGEGAAPRRHRDDDQNLDDLFGRGDAEHRAQRLRHPGIVRGPRESLRTARGRFPAARCWRRRAGRRPRPAPAGPGRSSAAMTSHSTSNAGAIAAAPMTVGRDSSSSICVELYLVRNENGYKFSRLQENQTRWRPRMDVAPDWSVFGELNSATSA